jgi:hypothetical protein
MQEAVPKLLDGLCSAGCVAHPAGIRGVARTWPSGGTLRTQRRDATVGEP